MPYFRYRGMSAQYDTVFSRHGNYTEMCTRNRYPVFALTVKVLTGRLYLPVVQSVSLPKHIGRPHLPSEILGNYEMRPYDWTRLWAATPA